MIGLKTWKEFIKFLEQEVNWDEPTLEQSLKVEYALRQISKYPKEFELRCNEIISNEELFNQYKHHSNYPRITMDKFMLYMDPEERFRVRLHRFKCKKLNGESTAKVHSHKWIYSSIILKGSYNNKKYKILEIDDKNMKATLTLDKEYTLEVGDTDSGLLNEAHQTINESDDENCITLFVRGKSIEDGAKIFNLEKETFYYTYSPDKQLKEGLYNMGRLEPNFH